MVINAELIGVAIPALFASFSNSFKILKFGFFYLLSVLRFKKFCFYDAPKIIYYLSKMDK